MIITKFTTLRESRGQRLERTWEWFCQAFENARETAQPKDTLPLYAPVLFVDDHRKRDKVQAVHAVGLDVDNGASFDETVTAFAGLDAVVSTTPGHTAVAPRLRVFVRPERPLTSEEYGRAWKLLASRVRGVDHNAKDASRAWFAPVRRPGGEYLCSVLRGAPLAVVDLPPSKGADDRHYEEDLVTGRIDEPPMVLAYRIERFVSRLPSAVWGERGNQATFNAAMKVGRGFNLTPKATFHFLQAWNRRCRPPWEDWELMRLIRNAIATGGFENGKYL